MTLRIASCHCGAVTLRFPLADFASVRRCDCSFCRRRGAIVASVPVGQLEVSGAEQLSLYQWGTRTAQHYFCKICGIYTHHRRRSDPSEYGVNVGNIHGLNPRELGEVPWSDGVNHPSDREA